MFYSQFLHFLRLEAMFGRTCECAKSLSLLISSLDKAIGKNNKSYAHERQYQKE
jgi:hypothetical protein